MPRSSIPLGVPLIRTRTVKKALSIAIRYSHLRHQGLELEHAHEDCIHVIQLLTEEFGYSEDNITVLTDCGDIGSQLPTRDNILQAMHDLVADSMPGDHLVCHISGHGSQRRCPFPAQEKDGLDEIFWPVDVEFGDDGIRNYILDDQIKDILVNGIQSGVTLVIIADCCHSGTMADLPHGHTDHMPRTRSLRFAGDGLSVYHDIFEEPSSTITEPDESTPTSVAQPSPHVICWSACRDDQETYKSRDSGGLFIRVLALCIKKNPSLTHRELLHEVTKVIGNLISAYKAFAPHKSSNIYAPKPHLSSLEYQTEIHGVPIRQAFGRNLVLAESERLRDAPLVTTAHNAS